MIFFKNFAQMSNKASTIIYWVFFTFSVNAQIPELNAIQASSESLLKSEGIEQARMYYNNSSFRVAEALFHTQLEKGTFEDRDYLLFANTLNADNKPALAKEFYLEYLTRSNQDNKLKINEIEDMFNRNAMSYNKKDISDKYSLNNPSFYNNKLFAAQGTHLKSYGINCNGELQNEIDEINNLIQKPIGSVTFINSDIAILSVADFVNHQTKLFKVSKKKGQWKKLSPVFGNLKGNFAFPYYSSKNNVLYFCSDKKGGYGGYDIYMSPLMGGDFEQTINLGNSINTPQHDINPIEIDNWLYFSSNGHISYGGYDLFKHKNIKDYNNVIRNCSDFNTSTNDLGILKIQKDEYLISSDGATGMRLVQFEKPTFSKEIASQITNKNGLPIEEAYVLINNDNNKAGNYLISDKKGRIMLETNLDQNYFDAIIWADGYEKKEIKIRNNATITLEKTTPIEIIKEIEKPVYRGDNPDNSNHHPTEKEEISKEQVEVIGALKTNNSPEAIVANRGLFYIIIGSAYNYVQAYDFWNKWIKTFNNIEILESPNGLYRVGYYAGSDETKAMSEYKKARKIKHSVWILRPQN